MTGFSWIGWSCFGLGVAYFSSARILCFYLGPAMFQVSL